MAVGIVGVGIMGGAIAQSLVADGIAVQGFDPDPQRQDHLRRIGATVAGSAAEAARGADLVLTSLPSAAALEETVASLLAAPRAGLAVAELSTLPIPDKERGRDRLATGG